MRGGYGVGECLDFQLGLHDFDHRRSDRERSDEDDHGSIEQPVLLAPHGGDTAHGGLWTVRERLRDRRPRPTAPVRS